MSARLRVGVLASGSGTNLQALLDTVHGREAGVVAVAAGKPEGGALGGAGGRRARAATARPGGSRARAVAVPPVCWGG